MDNLMITEAFIRLFDVSGQHATDAFAAQQAETVGSSCAGEYIAVEKVEAVYKKSALVEQIWVYGNSFENALVAVVVPNEDSIKSWASQNGVPGDYAAICRAS